jgi:hypothetical protein
MKKLSLVVIIMSALAPLSAFAHGTAISMAAEAVTQAAELFETHEAASLPLFTGIKGWPDQDKLQVKVYLSNNTTMQYTCTMADTGGQHVITCAKVP